MNGEQFNDATAPKVQIVSAASQVGRKFWRMERNMGRPGVRDALPVALTLLPANVASTSCTHDTCDGVLSQGPNLALWSVQSTVPKLADIKGKQISVDAPGSGLVRN